MKNQRPLIALLCCGALACSGGQTGEPDSGPPLACAEESLSGEAAAELFASFEGDYAGFVVSSTSSERCPEAEAVGVRVVITRTERASIADKPCGVRFVAVSVAVSSADGQLDSTVDGWLDERGRLSLSEGWVLVDSKERTVIDVSGFGELRSVESCCAEAPSEASVASLSELGATELLTLRYLDPSGTEHETRLALSLAAIIPSHACDIIDATFELHDANGELAASGKASMTYRSCAAANCVSLSVQGTGVVESEAVLLGGANGPGTLAELSSLSFSGESRDGALSVDRFSCELEGEGGRLLVLRSE